MIKELIDLIKSFLIAIVAAILVMTFIFRTVSVDGESMLPTLNNKDRLLVEKVSYYFREPKVGDIIVIKYPADPKQQYIKRIVAVGGDKIKIKNNKLYVNGKEIKENYINEEMNSSIDSKFNNEIEIPKDTVFVLGDNRNHSKDSRYDDVGYVDVKLIVGRANFRIYPFKDIGKVR